jgi:hypothetical protein
VFRRRFGKSSGSGQSEPSRAPSEPPTHGAASPGEPSGGPHHDSAGAGHQSGSIGSRLAALASLATCATLNRLLERTLLLPDSDLLIFADALRTCGMVADESGSLMPALSCEVASVALFVNRNPAQQQRILAVFRFHDVEVCVPGRSIVADAMDALAATVRSTHSDLPVDGMRKVLRTRLDPGVDQQLLDHCESLKSLVAGVESRSICVPESPDWPAGDPLWARVYYEPIHVLESLGREAMSGSV